MTAYPARELGCMFRVMDAAWVGVIGVLSGVIVAAVADAARASAAFRREKRWTTHKRQRHRLEMVYVALEELRESYGDGVVTTSFVVRFGKKPERAVPPLKAPWSRLRMVVHLYTPWLVPRLEAVNAAGKALGVAMGRAITAQRGEPEYDEPNVAAMERALKELSGAIDQMTDEVVQSVRQVDREVLGVVGTGAPRVATAPDSPSRGIDRGAT